MHDATVRPRHIRSSLLLLALLAASPVAAYSPGSGTLYADDFEGTLDADWELETGVGTATSPWTQVTDGADESFNADGIGLIGMSPTKHWARHFLHPSVATTFSVAFEYRAELGPTYLFDLEIEQRAPTLKRYRLRVEGDGALSLWRADNGAMVPIVSTGAGALPVNQKRWIRLAIEPDPSGHPRVRARVWGGGATAEPASWTVEFLDELDTVERVHRFELVADGPQGVETWIDDVDAWGDTGDGVISPVEKIYIVEHSHVDIGFTEPPDEIEQFAKDHLDQVLNNLEADSDYRWTIENGWCLDRWWERSTDAERQRMIGHLQSGRLPLAANYTNLTTTAAGHEELSRAVYWSSGMGREHDFPVRTWFQDDVPGATFAMPEILARAGMEFYLGGMNTTFGGDLTNPDHGDQPFWWVGPDGSRVLAWISFDSYAAAFDYGFSFFDNLATMYEKMGKKLPEMEEVGYPWKDLMLQRAFDNHYQGFHARNLVNQWNANYANPVFVLATAEEFFDHMLATHGPDAFPSFSGDFGAAWGWLTAYAQNSQAWIRQAHREGRAAEAMLAAGSAVDGDAVPHDDADFLYRKMLEFDEHTNAGGWPGYYTPEEMDRHNRHHLAFARDARDTASALLIEGIDRSLDELSASGDAVAAVNALGRTRDGWVRIALPSALYGSSFRVVERGSGTEVPYQRFAAMEEILFRAESVPAMGYRVYDLLPGQPTASPSGTLDVTATTLENDFYRVEIDAADGSVVSMIHKPTALEMVDTASPYRFNELATNTHQDAVLLNPPLARPPGSATVSIEWSGPLLASLRVTRTGTSHVETTYRLYRGEDRVEFENVLDRDFMAYVPNDTHTISHTVTLPFDIHDFEIRSETTTRFLDPVGDSFGRSRLFDYHDVEHTLAFWDQNLGVLYAVDNSMVHHFENISNLSSPSYSTTDAMVLTRLKDKRDEYEYAGGTIGTFVMEPDAPTIYDLTHHVRATQPGFNPAEASRFGFEALSSLIPRLLPRRPGNLPDVSASFFSIDSPDVLLYTAKPADDDNGTILRIAELSGTPATVAVSSDVFTLLQGERVEQDEDGGDPLAMAGNDVLVPLGAFETATVRVQTSVSWTPIVLTVGKSAGTGEVLLNWSGGVSPYTLHRSESAAFSGPVTTLVDEQAVNSHADPVLGDGQSYFYLAR